MSDREVYATAVYLSRMAAEALEQQPLEELLAAIRRAESVGPILDPTLYRAKSTALEEDRQVLAAALQFVRAVQAVKEAAEKRRG